jgi:ribosome-binding factor A
MGRDNPRRKRLAAEIHKELAELLRREVKDSRIGNVTITHVELTGDLREARVYYLPFGREGDVAPVQRGLERACGFLRSALAKALGIRYTPTLSFAVDESIERGLRIASLLKQVSKPVEPPPSDE